MPTFTNVTTVAAGATALPIQGSLWEYIPFNAKIDFSMVQLTGGVANVVATVNSGPDTLLEEAPISAAARFPISPDDYFLSDEVAAGDRIKVQLRNTTGAAISVVTVLQITPI